MGKFKKRADEIKFNSDFTLLIICVESENGYFSSSFCNCSISRYCPGKFEKKRGSKLNLKMKFENR